MLLERRVSGGGGNRALLTCNFLVLFLLSVWMLCRLAKQHALLGLGSADMLWAIGLVVVVTAPVEAPAVLFGFW
ncbi:hypothetical protein DY000_02039375 [Brassica cretica]|uniref:Uncharacterized protein n=1 Tax=Brassica cretica TaxID=69181 RepID=A0ABQ7BET8_BRACR|nr:hypothetical protein DY000_02039375 [Brassica cretica]